MIAVMPHDTDFLLLRSYNAASMGHRVNMYEQLCSLVSQRTWKYPQVLAALLSLNCLCP